MPGKKRLNEPQIREQYVDPELDRVGWKLDVNVGVEVRLTPGRSSAHLREVVTRAAPGPRAPAPLAARARPRLPYAAVHPSAAQPPRIACRTGSATSRPGPPRPPVPAPVAAPPA